MLDKTAQARPGSLDNVLDARVTLAYMAPHGHTLEDCLRPAYWSNVRRECAQQRVHGRHAWNKIEIIAEDGTWEAVLRIVTVDGSGLVHTRLLSHWQEQAAASAAPAPSGYTVEHIPDNGWRALDPRGQLLIEKCATRDKALEAAEEHATRASPSPRKGGK